MTIAPAHLEALERLGYTEPEARFLYIVATHSGYFLARQFLAFTGAHWGKRTTLFWNRFERLKHIRAEHFPKSGVVYHLYSRKLYRLIDRENIRNRRTHEIEFIKRRIAILDFVLMHQEHFYLETEPEKVGFFSNEMAIATQFLPARLYAGKPGSTPAVRYFVDKFPMYRAGVPAVAMFTYVHEDGSALADFVRHLETYLPLFRELFDFGLIYASRTAVYSAKAQELFDSLVRVPLESDIAEELLRYFRVRKGWDEKQYATLSDGDLVFRNEARSRFRGERFEKLYREWTAQRVSGDAIRREFRSDGRKRTVRFSTCLIPRVAPSIARENLGEEGKNDIPHLTEGAALHPPRL